MPVNNLRNLHRDGANFIFRNQRLFIGWHVWEDHRTEAWLGVLNNDAAGREGAQITTDWLRIYTSSDGPEQLTNDVMGINLLRPALIERHAQGSDQAFLDLGRGDRLRYLETRYNHVMNGRYKCCEYEGGMLHVMTPPRTPAPVKKNVQKRRRDSSESEEEEEACRAADGKKRRCIYDCYDDDGDDDEEIPPQLIKQEPKDNEATQPIASNTLPGEQLSPSVAALSLRPDHDPVEELSAPPTALVPQAQSTQRPAEPTSLPDSARGLRTALLDRIVHWQTPTGSLKKRLSNHLCTLFELTDAAEILSEAQEILRSVGEYCDGYTSITAWHQQVLEKTVEKGMTANDIEIQRGVVETRKKAEKDLREDVGKLKDWADRLEGELNAES